MNLATNLFLVYIVYFIKTYLGLLLNKKKRITHQQTRKRLNELRKIPIKTLEEQKEFLDLKYPKTIPFKWSVINILKIILYLGTMISVFIFTRYLWKTYILFEFKLYQTMLIMVFLPILFNMILKKFGLEQDDLRIFF